MQARRRGVVVGLRAARQKALTQWRVGRKTDPQLARERQQFFFRLPGPQGVLVLDDGDRTLCVGAADKFRGSLGQAEVGDLAGIDKLADRARHLLDGNLWVDAVLHVDIQVVAAEAAQRTLRAAADDLRAGVDLPRRRTGGVDVPPELGEDGDVGGGQGIAKQLLPGVRPLDLRGVEEVNARVDRAAQHLNHLRATRRIRIGMRGHRRAAEPHLGHGERGAAGGESASIHARQPNRRSGQSRTECYPGLAVRSLRWAP